MNTLKKRGAVAVVLLAAIIFFLGWYHEGLLNALSAPLVRKDALRSADAIVVLTGDHSGDRMMTAIDLYKKGYGKRIVFWGGPLYWKITWAEMFLADMEEFGVPQEAALWEEGELTEVSTRGEAEVTFRLMNDNGINSFILVTSPFHTARAAFVYEPLAERYGKRMYVSPSRDTYIQLTGWWKSRRSARKILNEWVKTVFYWVTV